MEKVKQFVYLKFNPETGKTEVDRVADCHPMFNFQIKEEEQQLYSAVTVEGEKLDVQFVTDQLFPQDDPTILPVDERDNRPDITKGEIPGIASVID
jgi:hypothetical protein